MTEQPPIPAQAPRNAAGEIIQRDAGGWISGPALGAPVRPTQPDQPAPGRQAENAAPAQAGTSEPRPAVTGDAERTWQTVTGRATCRACGGIYGCTTRCPRRAQQAGQEGSAVADAGRHQ